MKNIKFLFFIIFLVFLDFDPLKQNIKFNY